MNQEFNANEIFIMAEQIEIEAYKFYLKAAEETPKEEDKAFLKKLASFEVEHQNLFSEMREKLSDQEKTELTFDPNNEVEDYCRSFARMQNIVKRNVDFTNMKEILLNAIMIEKDTIVFYSGMKKFVSEAFGKGRIDELIHEELRHIDILTKQYDSITTTA